MDPLHRSLLDLLRELDGRGVPLTVGGGYGLYLKRAHLARTGQRTLFSELPDVRSTNDIDLFLRAEVLADLSRTKEVADAIKRLGCDVVEEAKYLQWKRPVVVAGVEQEVKLDVLVGPLGPYRGSMQVRPPRARPKGDIQFHAHMTEEALHIEDQPIGVPVGGVTSDGKPYSATVYVPEAFPYLLMKLHAFEDRRGKEEQAEDQTKKEKERAKERQHAIDLYTIVGMMTEEEYEHAKELGTTHAGNEHVGRARMIVQERFASPTALGVLRLREHPLFRSDLRLEDFMGVLGEVFPGG